MVIFRSADGKPGYHQADALEAAVRFVEMLRNQEQVNEARIFRMEEVTFEFRPYFRVEIAGEKPPAAEPATVGAAANGDTPPAQAHGGRLGRFGKV